VIDVERLSSPLEGGEGCGRDMEYDADFLSLEQASKGKEEQQFGETIVPAEEPDWLRVKQLCLTLLEQTRDIRVAVMLTRASAHLDGLGGYLNGIRLLHAYCERYWTEVFPRLDPDFENDPVMRINALSTLSAGDGGLRDLRLCTFLKGRVGTVTGRDFFYGLGSLDVPAGISVKSDAELSNLISAFNEDIPGSPDVITQAYQAVDELQKLIVEKAGGQNATDFKPILKLLNAPAKLVKKVLSGAEEEQSAEEGSGAEVSSEGTGGGGGFKISGSIKSREDAYQALERVCDYFEKYEPANPAPLFIRRAQKVMTMNFVDIVQELVPESLSQLKNLAGLNN
jgi:type VI secretion system protein ImpA